MCLSTAYRNKLEPDAIAMKNVMVIECREGQVVLTDLMERQMVLNGYLDKANLVEGYVVVRETLPA